MPNGDSSSLLPAERAEWIERWLRERATAEAKRNVDYANMPLEVAVSMGLELLADRAALLARLVAQERALADTQRRIGLQRHRLAEQDALISAVRAEASRAGFPVSASLSKLRIAALVSATDTGPDAETTVSKIAYGRALLLLDQVPRMDLSQNQEYAAPGTAAWVAKAVAVLTEHTGFGDCACYDCWPPEPVLPDEAPLVVPAFGFWRSLWLVLRGERLNDWSVLVDGSDET